MRDIRFRAWDKVNNKMLSHKDMLDGSWDNWPTLFFAITDNDIYIPMQFTGLHDKNGKEIYEGDILKGIFTPEPPASFHGNFPKSYGILVEVIFDDASFLFKNLWKGKLSRAWERKRLTDNRIDEIEIIGNIYENPELVGK
jgi:uncharacterized phage protein (TIGR01671 family)